MAKVPDPNAPSGFINVNKDAGMTSMDVIRQLRRITGERKMGHGGTLDPAAVGVLPIALNRATRFIEYIVDGTKVYSMRVKLGAATNTYDADGEVTETSDPSHVDRSAIEAMLPELTGEISQVPPMYSALKKNGVRLYELARKGIEVERDARDVKVGRLEMSGWSHSEFDLEVECGRGFYARSLANDLAIRLGTHGHLISLSRLSVGRFAIDDAVTLADLETDAQEKEWQTSLRPIDSVLEHLPALKLNPLSEEQMAHGQPVRAVPAEIEAIKPPPDGEVRVYGADGEFIALAMFDDTGPWWKPVKVVSPA